MTNEAKLYADLFEHIQAFDLQFGSNDEDWHMFIADINKRIAFKYIDAQNEQSPDSK